MPATQRDTIVAIASPPGAGRRGVLRISGTRAAQLVAAVFRAEGAEPARARGGASRAAQQAEPSDRFGEPRGVYAGRFDDGAGTQPCFLLWMPGPGSYTREDVAELHLPGSPPLLACALRRVLEEDDLLFDDD